jgi:CRP-like cAMP-binding protein
VDIDFEDPKYEIFIEDGVVRLKYLGKMHQGEAFGELALTSRKSRSATLIATQDCWLGTFTKKDFDEILFELEVQKVKKMAEFFTQTLKVNFTTDEVTKLSSIFQKMKFAMNDYIFKAGEKAEGFYIIKRGEVNVIVVDSISF